METHKEYALVDDSGNVVNVAVFDSSATEDMIKSIAEANGATRWYDTATYGGTSIGGFFDGERLWHPKPFPSWIQEDGKWVPPFMPPAEVGFHPHWDEESLSWKPNEMYHGLESV